MTKQPEKRKDFPINRAFEYCLKVLSGEISFNGSIKDLEKTIKQEFNFPTDRAKLLVKKAVEEFNQRKKQQETNEIPEPPKNETTLQIEFSKINLKGKYDIEILENIHQYQKISIAIQHSSVPRSTFYKRIKLMVKNGVLVEIKGKKKGTQSTFVIHPSFLDNFLPNNVLPAYVSQKPLIGRGDENRVSLSENSLNSETSAIEPIREDIENGPTIENLSNDQTMRGKYETTLEKIFKMIQNFDPTTYAVNIKQLRTHNLVENLRIVKKPINLIELLEKSQYFGVIPRIKNWKPFHNKGTIGTLSHLELKAYIRFNVNVVTIAIPEIIGPNAYFNSMKGFQQILAIKELLENEFHGLELEPNLEFKLEEIKSPEHAIISGLPALQRLAIESREMKISLKGKNLMIDESPGKPESEFIDRVKSSTHVMKEFEDYDFRAENDIYFQDLVQDLGQLKDSNQFLETKILERLKEVEDNLDVKIELESLQNQIEIEKLRNQQLNFQSSLIPFIQNLHDQREKNEKGILDILIQQANTLENQQQTLNLLSEKILRKSIFERVVNKLKAERR